MVDTIIARDGTVLSDGLSHKNHNRHPAKKQLCTASGTSERLLLLWVLGRRGFVSISALRSGLKDASTHTAQ